MKVFTLAVLTSLLFQNAIAQSYSYTIDLGALDNDRLKVKLDLEGFNNHELTYHFPKVIPGTYAIADYGKYISGFEAFDKEGNVLRVKKNSTNSYIIQNASDIASINYSVDDTWDSHVRKNKVFEPAGTSFHKGNHFFLNNPGLFGYFEGAEDSPIQITFKNPGKLYGSSALSTEFSKESQIFHADSYFELTDSPILFSQADTFSFSIKNCKVHVAICHSTGKKLSDKLKKVLMKSMKATSGFFENMPSDEYTFLIFIKDEQAAMESIMDKPNILSIAKLALKYPGLGALEHHKSSTYFLIDLGDIPDESIISTFQYDHLLESVAIHEFMHTLTPLQLRTEFIDDFNYQDPKMSKHLWLYEGVTEYFAEIMPVKAGQMPPEAYLNKIVREKWENAQNWPYKKMTMTEMSSNVLKKKYHRKYNQVYQYGPMLALCLDLEIIKLTNGQKDLRSVLLEISQTYNSANPIPEDRLFDILVEYSHPEIRKFIDDYIDGNKELLINHYLHYAGIRYFLFHELHQSVPIVSNAYGIKSIDRSSWKIMINGKFTVNEVLADSPFKAGDEVNYFEFRNQVKDEYGLDRLKEGDIVTLNVLNNGESRQVSFPIKFREITKSDYYQIDSEVEDKILNVRQKWWSF